MAKTDLQQEEDILYLHNIHTAGIENAPRMNTPASQEQDPWFALQVRSGREPYVASLLESKGLTVYNPQITTRTVTARGARQKTSALFPGYLFCRIDMNNRMPVLGTTWVGAIVGTGRAPVPVPDIEIESLKTLVANAAEVLPHEYLDVGQRVRVSSGPLNGLEGIVSDVKSQRRIVVSITLLQRSVAAEIDTFTVEPLSAPSPAVHLLHRKVA